MRALPTQQRMQNMILGLLTGNVVDRFINAFYGLPENIYIQVKNLLEMRLDEAKGSDFSLVC